MKRLDSYFPSLGKKTGKKARRNSPKYYQTQRITRFIPDQNARNVDASNFMHGLSDRAEYQGPNADELTHETLAQLTQGHSPASMAKNLASLRKFPYLKKFSDDQLMTLPLAEVFGLVDIQGMDRDERENARYARELNDYDYEEDNDAVEDRVSPEHVHAAVPGHVTLTREMLQGNPTTIPIPNVIAPKFIDGNDFLTTDHFETGDRLVEVKKGKVFNFMTRNTFNDMVRREGANVKDPVTRVPWVGCVVRQFIQPARGAKAKRSASARAQRAQSRKPGKRGRARQVSRKMFKSKKSPVD